MIFVILTFQTFKMKKMSFCFKEISQSKVMYFSRTRCVLLLCWGRRVASDGVVWMYDRVDGVSVGLPIRMYFSDNILLSRYDQSAQFNTGIVIQELSRW